MKIRIELTNYKKPFPADDYCSDLLQLGNLQGIRFCGAHLWLVGISLYVNSTGVDTYPSCFHQGLGEEASSVDFKVILKQIPEPACLSDFEHITAKLF